MINLGTPTTLGELRKMTEQYPDETLLQFRNEPRHELFFDEEQGLMFQEEPLDLKISLKKILAEYAYKMENMQVDDDVIKLCKTIHYLDVQMSMISRFVDDEYKNEQRESIKKVIQIATKILQK